MRFFFTFILSVVVFNVALGQISQGGFPIEVQELKSAGENVYELPFVNNKLLKQTAIEQSADEINLKPLQFAHAFDVNLTTNNSGLWYNPGNGLRVWKLKIRSEGAKSLNLIFDNFALPRGSRLFLYNKKENHYLGAFTDLNNKPFKKFAVSPVAGDEITIQYEVPREMESIQSFKIAQVNHDYIGVLKYSDRRPLGILAGDCNIDVNCEIGADWKEVKNSVCRLIVNGREICTGTLINSTAEEVKPYILSAAHCYDKLQYAETTVYTFNYESPYCAPLDGDPRNSISGAVMRAWYDSLDFALTEMSLVPPPEFMPYYAGWDRSGTLPDSTVSIHHPQGDIKKIAFDNDPPVFSDFNTSYHKNGFIKISRWDNGVTEVGSSGGALFNPQEQIIGTLTGGVATCESPVKDYFERFDVSWDFLADSAKQLKCWLDPINSGTNSINGSRHYQNQNYCAAFNHLNDADEQQMAPIYSLGKFSGYWGGTNSIDIEQIAERFSIPGNEQLDGVSIGVAKIYDNDLYDGSSITLKVYNGGELPETLIYTKDIALEALEEDAMNFIEFDEVVEPSDTFFVGVELSNMQPMDTFVVYQSLRDAVEESFFYFERNDNWRSYRDSYDQKTSITSFFEVIACNVKDIVNDTPLINNPVEIILYPNPANSIFTIETGIEFEPEDITVYDLIGREISIKLRNRQARKIQIDLTGNVPGVYFVRFNHGNGFVTKKVSYIPR